MSEAKVHPVKWWEYAASMATLILLSIWLEWWLVFICWLFSCAIWVGVVAMVLIKESNDDD